MASYEVSIKIDQDILHITATGLRSLNSILGVLDEGITAIKLHGQTKVLVDISGLMGRLQAWEVFKMVTFHFGKVRQNFIHTRTAILDLPEALERVKFFETVARNRGYDVCVFIDREAAVDWLVQNSEDVLMPPSLI